MANIPPVILKASGRQSATLIFLHGLGDTGYGWAGALNTIKPKYLKVICPTANSIPVTCNGGMNMPAWYDILDINAVGEKREDLSGVKESSDNLDALIESEESLVPRNRIMIGGFSQGGALALYNVLKNQKKPLGGCVALSCYLPGNSNPYEGNEINTTPILQIHGTDDLVVPFHRGSEAGSIISKAVKEHEFKAINGMGHEGCLEEMNMIKNFIKLKIPE